MIFEDYIKNDCRYVNKCGIFDLLSYLRPKAPLVYTDDDLR
jgi:hypothetical protein